MIEEICMLDHISGGRLEIGFGRGSVPYEISYLRAERRGAPADLRRTAGTDPEGVQTRRTELRGKYDHVRKRAAADRAVAEAASAAVVRRAFAGQRRARRPQGPAHGHQRSCRRRPAPSSRAIVDVWREAQGANRAAAQDGHGAIRSSWRTRTTRRLQIARRAYLRWRASFTYLHDMHGTQVGSPLRAESFDTLVKQGQAIAGSPRDRDARS